uniref:SRPBCC family protein n=1 Tax=Sedimenticola sp. TaxID=1940285 RepID=UPI003D0CB834
MYGSDDHVFTLSHICRAPIELVWQIWTGEQYLQNWLQPEEMHMTPMSMELHPEGEFRYRLSTTDDSKMWGKWVFIEIDPLERLV